MNKEKKIGIWLCVILGTLLIAASFFPICPAPESAHFLLKIPNYFFTIIGSIIVLVGVIIAVTKEKN